MTLATAAKPARLAFEAFTAHPRGRGVPGAIPF